VSSSQLTEARDRVRSFGGYNRVQLSAIEDFVKRRFAVNCEIVGAWARGNTVPAELTLIAEQT